MYRNELKYMINAHQKDVMTHKAHHLFERDSYSDAAGAYVVSSLYFDDYHQSAFFDKVNGIRGRKKFRVRIYNHQPDVIKLERKIKRENVTEKNHIRITREAYDALVCGDAGFLKDSDEAVARDFYLAFQTRNLRPRVVVEYRREAFMYRYGDVRITFDTLLKAGPFQKDLFARGHLIPALPGEQIILEVKFTGYLPDVVRSSIQIDNLQWQSISKYARCCAAGM